MEFDYFYGAQSDQYAFYRIPKMMIVEEVFEKLSTDAKLLYGLLLDRVSLSASSGWFDDEGRVYIIYTLKRIQKDMHCSDKTATKLLRELEAWGLVERRSQGQGKPSLIYVKNFLIPSEILRVQNRKKYDSRVGDITIPESEKLRPNNTNSNNTKYINTNPILSGKDADKDEREAYYQYFYDRLELAILLERYPYDKETLTGILDLILDVVCSNRHTIRIAGDDKPVSVVKAQFMKLDSSHIEYVMDCFQENSASVRNMKQYMLAALYNAPITKDNYYRTMVKHDMVTNTKKKRKDNGYIYEYAEGETL